MKQKKPELIRDLYDVLQSLAFNKFRTSNKQSFYPKFQLK